MALLAGEITRRIIMDYEASGTTRLPGERELAQQYRCSRQTIRTALKTLAKDGRVKVIPRNGYFLKMSADAKKNVGLPAEIRQRKNDFPVILMLAFGECMKDPNYLDLIAGAINEAAKQKVNLTVTELAVSEFSRITDVRTLHRGLSVDGYIIGGHPPVRMKEMIEKFLRPTALIGEFYHQGITDQYPRFIQFISPVETVYRQVAQHLISLGHKKIMLVFDSESAFRQNVTREFAREFTSREIDPQNITAVTGEIWDYQSDSFAIPSKKLAEKVINGLNDQTAMVVFAGAWLGLEIWKALQEKKVRIPEELSLIIGSGRTDIFVEVFNIATIFCDSWNVGVMCIQEIASQIKEQRLEYGIRWVPQTYLVGKTVGPAPVVLE